jgi:uncharacterized membrane protein
MNGWVHIFNGATKLRIHQSFMEKKIKRTQKKPFSNNEEKTIIITILIALIVFAALLVKLTFFTPIATEPFSGIYYLDSEKQTTNIPKTVILGENSTFSLWIGVENQNETSTPIDYIVKVKIDKGKEQINPSLANPVETFENALNNGETWEFPITINIEKAGTNRIIFELWYTNTTETELYTGNWVNLSVEAIQ